VSEDLIARWLDDRAGLTGEEAEELARVLGSDPELAQRVKDQLLTDELLSRRLAVDRRNFDNQIAQRIVGSGSEGRFLQSTLDAVRVGRQATPSWRSRLPEAAAAAILIAGLFLILRKEPPAPVVGPASARHGLHAQYYAGLDLRGAPVERIDPTVNFQWSAGQPPIPAGKDVYSVRWTGTLTPKFSERYTIHARYDDGLRIWVGGVKILDDWNGRYVVTERRVEVELNAGRPTPVKIEYFNGGDRGVAQIRWSSASQPEEILPESSLSPE
jgi:hypothetical protein